MAQTQFKQLQTFLEQQVIGQPELVEHLLIALLADGHLLVEGPPGLAKTRAIQSLTKGIEGSFHRVQFTPDLLPADLTGTDIYRPETGEFVFQPGPLFHSLVLADEINRAPAKVQAALLEAMAERQITVGKKTYKLSDIFTVMATQNPLEQEGTYPLPEAQLDRFLMKILVDYPDAETELAILQLNRREALRISVDNNTPSSSTQPPTPELVNKLTKAHIVEARQQVLQVHMDAAVEQYLIALVMATRKPQAYHADLARWIAVGVSPRATIALDHCVRAKAWLQQRDYVTPTDIKEIVTHVFRHRLILTYEAQAQGLSTDDVIQTLLQHVPLV